MIPFGWWDGVLSGVLQQGSAAKDERVCCSRVYESASGLRCMCKSIGVAGLLLLQAAPAVRAWLAMPRSKSHCLAGRGTCNT